MGRSTKSPFQSEFCTGLPTKSPTLSHRAGAPRLREPDASGERAGLLIGTSQRALKPPSMPDAPAGRFRAVYRQPRGLVFVADTFCTLSFSCAPFVEQAPKLHRGRRMARANGHLARRTCSRCLARSGSPDIHHGGCECGRSSSCHKRKSCPSSASHALEVRFHHNKSFDSVLARIRTLLQSGRELALIKNVWICNSRHLRRSRKSCDIVQQHETFAGFT